MRDLIVCLALAPCCWAQSEPSIRVNVRLINVEFSVHDAAGRLVNDLTRDDVEVLEDGTPQTVSFFSRSADLPLRLGLIIDGSGSQEHFEHRHEHDLKEFLKDVLGPRDQAFLLGFGNHLRLVSDFSGSHDEMADRLKDYLHQRGHFPEIGPPDHRELGTAFYDALYYAATLKLAPVDTGRRAAIVFSDGEDNSSAHHMLDAIEAAQAENVVVYSIRYTEVGKHGMTARNKYGISVMGRIVRETGGTDFDAEESDLRTCFRQIGEDLRSSYELGYHSTNPADDGTFHKLLIRVKRPGVRVRTKTGYYARQSAGM